MKKKNKTPKSNLKDSFRLFMEIIRTGVPIAILVIQIGLYIQ